MRREWVFVPALLGLVAVLHVVAASGSARTSRARPARVNVAIENYAFQPDPITISAGTTVVWTNHDEVAHTVVSVDKLFSSPELEPSRSFEFTFNKAGTFPYSCTLHPEMKGKVIVK